MRVIVTIVLVFFAAVVNGLEPLRFQKVDKGTYRVVRVYDGDTFTILVPPNYTVNIRINGIDAPERRQEFGMYARLYLVELIGGKPVKIIPIELDKWGRMVATCYTDDGKDIALEMLKAGMAWHYDGYDNTRAYIQAEREARYTQEGLWCRPNPMSPQEYRSAPRQVKRKNQ